MIRVSILGASGYAGGELIRILLDHPYVTLHQLTSRKFANMPITTAHPNLRGRTNLIFIHPDQLEPTDLLIVALPNTQSMQKMTHLKNLAEKIIDLGADYRLNNPQEFEKWYKIPHTNPEDLNNWTYGIAELHRQEIKQANYIACAGCEATVSILALKPLIDRNLIEKKIIIDAKMSSSQSGLEHSLSTHHPERAHAVRSYMPTGHRHTAEIVQECASNETLDVAISATALDMVRGLLVTIHTIPKSGITEKEIWKAYREHYKNEPFIRIIKEKHGIYRYPEPKLLWGTNYCDIGFEIDNITKRLVIIACIDNLVKGTAGQAIQSMNLMYNFEETTALTFPGLHPI
mgnify:CR=1 FL=1